MATTLDRSSDAESSKNGFFTFQATLKKGVIEAWQPIVQQTDYYQSMSDLVQEQLETFLVDQPFTVRTGHNEDNDNGDVDLLIELSPNACNRLELILKNMAYSNLSETLRGLLWPIDAHLKVVEQQ